MSTLVVRLHGPLQSYGEASKFKSRGTLRYPSYAALLGMCRAALGIGRSAPREESEFLFDLRMAIRLDKTNPVLVDYQTVNPADPSKYGDAQVSNIERRIEVVANSRNLPYVMKKSYLQDSEFMWFIEGDDAAIHQLENALMRPTWQLSLGRKACLPDWPMVLGVTPESIQEVAGRIPIVKRARSDGDTGKRTLHLFGEAGSVANFDRPLGNHPDDGYTTMTREAKPLIIDHTAKDHRELLNWARENL